MHRTAFFALLVFLLAAGCAPSAPASLPPFPAADLESPVEDAALICTDSARVTPWKTIKVPAGYRPKDVALASERYPQKVWK